MTTYVTTETGEKIVGTIADIHNTVTALVEATEIANSRIEQLEARVKALEALAASEKENEL